MRRLFRRLLPRLFDVVCLLSLLACAGSAWLWGRAIRSGAAEVEIAALRMDLAATSTPSRLSARAIVRWPGEWGAWAREQRGPGWEGRYTEFGRWFPAPQPWHSHLWDVRFETGDASVFLRPDGSPARLSQSEWARNGSRRWTDLWLSGPLPYWELADVPPWLALGFLAAPPLLRLTLRARRLYLRRRRRRLGLCLRCGYDLTGNPSGVCSECGAEVEAATPGAVPTAGMRNLPLLFAATVLAAASAALALGAGCASNERPAPPPPASTPSGPGPVVIDEELGGNLTFRDGSGEVVAVADLKLPDPLPDSGKFEGWWYVRSAKAGSPARAKEGGRYRGRASGGGVSIDLDPDTMDAGVGLAGSPQGDSLSGTWYRRGIAGGEPGGTFVLTRPRAAGK